MASINNTKLRIQFIWIPNAIGGHRTEPYDGMRTGIRWQKHLKESLEIRRDVTWGNVIYDSQTFQGEVVCQLLSELPTGWNEEGELVEILGGYNVLAVGKIVQPNN